MIYVNKFNFAELRKMRNSQYNSMRSNKLTNCLGKMKTVRHNRIGWILIVPILFLSGWVSAQNINLDVSAPRVVQVGEQFRLAYSFNAKGSNFQEPAITDFSVLTGPNTSSSSSIQIINGSMSQSVNYTYTYILAASSEGKFTIPAASIQYKGKTYQSNPVTIEVVKGSNSAASSGQSTGGPSGGPSTSSVDAANVSNSGLFVVVSDFKSHD